MSFSLLSPWSWYLLAAAGHAVLACYALIAGGRGLLRSQILLVAAGGILWGGLLAGADGSYSAPTTPPGFALDLSYTATWYLLLHRMLRGPYRQSMPELVRRCLMVFWSVAVAMGLVVGWLWLDRGPTPWFSAALDGIGLAAALSCLSLAAQLGRDAPIEGRRGLKALVAAAALAAGGQALVMSVGLLSGFAPPAVLAGRAMLTLGAVASLGYAVRLKPQWSLAIFVSPQARSYLPRLMAMAVVLLVLVAAVPLCRALPADSIYPAAVLVIGLTGSPVAALLFSERLSARVRVFLSKRFLPFRYDYREEWLRLIDTLSSPDQRLPLPERSIKAVAQIVSSPAGLLWMRSEPEGPLACVAGWNTKMWSDARVPADDPVIAFMFERQWILDTAELARNPDLYDRLPRPPWLEQFPDALLLVPLISNEALIGFMLLMQSSSAFRLTFEEIDLLRTSGRQVAAHLAQYDADQRLGEIKQFEAFNRLTAFLMHDLKNLIAQQSLVVRNAARHKGNPAFFEDAIATIDNSVARMSRLLQQLQSGETSGKCGRVRLSATLHDAVERCRGGAPEPKLHDVDEEMCANIDRDRFAMVMTHLIRNAQEATGSDGKVEVRAGRDDRGAVITIEDDGCGMDPDFVRTRLFRPFDTTKGSKGMGIGAYQARTFVVDSGGTLEVSSKPGQGTRITIRLPLAEAAEATA
ncbi:MAG: PEP-CTERM system histidine kinase PrsK [Gammaproteobacteria bacterium]|nr:MAG: PEP-CTERM system histidine kinase PrsK [Gammaproteobacteria bacterium]